MLLIVTLFNTHYLVFLQISSQTSHAVVHVSNSVTSTTEDTTPSPTVTEGTRETSECETVGSTTEDTAPSPTVTGGTGETAECEAVSSTT